MSTRPHLAPGIPRLVGVALAVPFLVLAGWELLTLGIDFWGRDFGLYVRGAQRFLDTGTPYAPTQLEGPYPIFGEIFLYPPIALALMVPFVWLPAPLWWLMPAAVLVWAMWTWKPSPWAWPVLAACLAWPRTLGAIVAGNTDLWIAAFLAAGLVRGWPLAFVVLKPTVAPLVLFGAKRWRQALPGVAIVAVLSLLALPLWPQYLTSLANLDDPSPRLLYSLPSLPLLLVPVVAWLSRLRDPEVGGQPRPDAARTRLDDARLPA